MKNNYHTRDESTQQTLVMNGRVYWVTAIPVPMFTTKGLPIWKRFNEKNWRPQCNRGMIFNTLDEYEQHYYRESQET